MPAPSTYPSLAHALVARWIETPSAPAVLVIRADGLVELTQAELAARVIPLARRMREHGVGPGDVVAIRSKDKPRFLFASLATTLLGAAVIPVQWSGLHDFAEELVSLSGAKVLVTDQPAERSATAATLHLDDDVAVVSTDDLAWARTCTEGVGSSNLYMIQPTSGSTGVPKLAPRRHDTYLRIGWAIGLDQHPEALRRSLLALTLEHGGGHYSVAIWLVMGGLLVFPQAEDVDMTLRDLELARPTIMHLTPRVLASLHAQAQAKNLDAKTALAGLEVLVTGGAKSTPGLIAWMESGGVKVIEIYGASEFSVIAHTPWDSPRWTSEFVGPLLDDVEVQTAANGELLVKTPVMLTGYTGPRAPHAFTADGFYRTGDAGEIVDGKLRILGRARDVLNLFDGSNVYPSVIEEMIEALPWVHQIVVCGDQRPALAALVVVHPQLAGGEHERLLPVRCIGQYELAFRDLARLNDQLHSSEQVRAVVLLGSPFPSEILERAAIGKLKRDRKLAAERFRAYLDDAYGTDSPYRLPGPPGRDRRRDKRYPFSALVCLENAERSWFLYGRNLSLRGVKLACTSELPRELRFRVVGHELSREIHVRVVRAAQGEVSCEFAEPLSIADRDRLINR
jgi:long-chain acyl-CoA synthetase